MDQSTRLEGMDKRFFAKRSGHWAGGSRKSILMGVSKPKFTAKYTIRLDTANVSGAGTDADVEARILTTKGNSAWRILDSSADDREKGNKDYYRLYFEDGLADITGLELRVKKANENSPNWLLKTAWIWRASVNLVYELPYNKWINPVSYTEWVSTTLDKIIQHPPSAPFVW
jgi:hypothetical protein